jgi:transcriptional regulator with XRE-family HTH domain
MASKIFEELLASSKPENKRFVEKNLAISRQVRLVLSSHTSIKTQKDLADALNKEASEISRWLSGLHNIGLENITKMEAALGCDIILTDEQAKEKYDKPNAPEVFQRVQFSGSVERTDAGTAIPKGSKLVPVRSAKKKYNGKKNSSEIA